MKQTLKSMGITRTVIMKHGVSWWAYEYKNNFYTSREYALAAYERDHKLQKKLNRKGYVPSFAPERKFDGEKFYFWSLEYFKGDVDRIKNRVKRESLSSSRKATKVRVVPNTYTGEGWLVYTNKREMPHASYYRD